MAKNDDYVEHLFIASTHAYLMIFTDDGTVYKIKGHEVPDAAASARGKAIVNLISMPSDRKLAGVVPVRDFEEGRYVLMVTFFFQAEDGIRDLTVTGVQTCALPI